MAGEAAVERVGEVLPLAAADGPSVLVHCPRPSVDQWSWWVDLQYLAELHEAGFEVDYTDRHEDFTWDRVRRYDVVVIATVPLVIAVSRRLASNQQLNRHQNLEYAEKQTEFWAAGLPGQPRTTQGSDEDTGR